MATTTARIVVVGVETTPVAHASVLGPLLQGAGQLIQGAGQGYDDGKTAAYTDWNAGRTGDSTPPEGYYGTNYGNGYTAGYNAEWDTLQQAQP